MAPSAPRHWCLPGSESLGVEEGCGPLEAGAGAARLWVFREIGLIQSLSSTGAWPWPPTPEGQTSHNGS